MTETGRVAFGEKTIEYAIVRSARRRKTVALRVDPAGRVLVLAPAGLDQRYLRDFVVKQAAWIVGRLEESASTPPRPQLLTGSTVPYLGQTIALDVQSAAVRAPAATNTESGLLVRVPLGLDGDQHAHAVRWALERWYGRRALEYLDATVARWVPITGLPPANILIRDQKRRWASCAPDGTLRFNWRLVMAEPALIDYVVVHELAHLKHPNHSAAFWAEVERVIPDFKERRTRLRADGPQLSL